MGGVAKKIRHRTANMLMRCSCQAGMALTLARSVKCGRRCGPARVSALPPTCRCSSPPPLLLLLPGIVAFAEAVAEGKKANLSFLFLSRANVRLQGVTSHHSRGRLLPPPAAIKYHKLLPCFCPIIAPFSVGGGGSNGVDVSGVPGDKRHPLVSSTSGKLLRK